MPVLDYHYKELCQDIWQSDEIRLRTSVRDIITEQLSTRFPRCIGAYLVGDLTGHYYDPESDFDVVVHSSADDMKRYASEALNASGWILDGTGHKVNFYLLPAKTSVGAVSSKFGALFDLKSETWHSIRPAGNNSELANIDSLVKWVNWNLYKQRTSFVVDPYGKNRTHLLFDVFSTLKPREREDVISHLKVLAGVTRRGVSKALMPHSSPIWLLSDEFSKSLSLRTKNDHISSFIQNGLPKTVVSAVLNKFRYEYTIAQLEEQNIRLSKLDESSKMDRLPRVLVYSSVKGASDMGTNWETHHDAGYTAVVISGSAADLASSKPLFAAAGLQVEDSSPTSMIVRDVMKDSIDELTQITQDNHLSVVGTYGEKLYLRRTKQQVRRALKLSLQTDKWYFADNLIDFPFVMVRKSSIEKVADTDDEVQLLEIDMYETGTFTPHRQMIAAPDLASFGLRPATADDFKALGMITPVADQMIEASVAKTASPNYEHLKNFGIGVD